MNLNYIITAISVLTFNVCIAQGLFGEGGGSDGSGNGMGSPRPGEQYVVGWVGNKFMLIEKVNGENGIEKVELLSAAYDDINIVNNYYAFVAQNGAKGLYHMPTKKFLLPILYKDVDFIGDGWNGYNYLIVEDASGQKAVYSVDFGKCDQLTEFEYSEIKILSDQKSAKVMRSGKYGLLDLREKKFILEPEYNLLVNKKISDNNTSSDSWTIKKNDRFGLITETGTMVLKPVYDSVTEGHHYYIGWLGKNMNVFSKDTIGSIVKPASAVKCYNEILVFRSGKKMKWGFMRSDLKIVTEPVYDTIKISFDLRDDRNVPLVFAQNRQQLDMFRFAGEEWKRISLGKATIVAGSGKAFIVKMDGKMGAYDRKLDLICNYEYDKLNCWISSSKNEVFAGQIGKMSYLIENNMHIDSVIADSLALSDVFKYRAVKNGKYAPVLKTQGSIPDFSFDYVAISVGPSIKMYRRGGYCGRISSTGKCLDSIPLPVSGFADFQDIPGEFMEALKSDNDSVLQIFARKMSPDYWTYEYFDKKRGDLYRFYREFDFYKVNEYADGYYKALLKFRESLKSKDLLDKIKTTGFKNNTISSTSVGYEHYVKMSDSPVMIIAGEEQIEFKLGDLFLLGGNVKTFNKPGRLN